MRHPQYTFIDPILLFNSRLLLRLAYRGFLRAVEQLRLYLD